MFIICVVVTVVLAVMLVFSASLKLRKDPESVRVINGVVGVPVRYFSTLAAFELAGAAGLAAGLWIAPLGVAAAAGVVLYFALAVAAHIRVSDRKGVLNPSLPLVAGLAALVLRIATV
jgi:hypothetical protein